VHFSATAELFDLQQQVLYFPFLGHWETQGEWAEFPQSIYLQFIEESARIYKKLATSYPYQLALFKREIERNKLFKNFISGAQGHPWSRRLPYKHFLAAPNTFLVSRCQVLDALKREYGSNRASKCRVDSILDSMKALTLKLPF
jgi:hypothetical protein